MRVKETFEGVVTEQQADEGTAWLEIPDGDGGCHIQTALHNFGTPARYRWESFTGRRVRVTLTIEDADEDVPSGKR